LTENPFPYLSGSHVAPVRMLILIHDSPHAEAGNPAAGTFFYRIIVHRSRGEWRNQSKTEFDTFQFE
jgi:hypothetical protein